VQTNIAFSPIQQSDQAFDSAGAARAPAILLVHGSVVSRKMWLPQLRGLADTYRVIAPDLPGHGLLADVPFTFSSAVETLADVIHRQANGRALVAGLSLGGYVAIELAHRCPELVAGLVLSGSSRNFQGILAAYLRLVSWLIQRGWLRLRKEQAEQRVKRMFPPALADVAEQQLQAGVFPDVLAPAYAEMAGRDFAALLGTYPGPCLILNGEKDASSRRDELRFVSAARQGQARLIPGAAHACNLDQPEQYNLAVREFARSIGWAPGQVA